MNQRYTTYSMRVAGRPMWYVIDTHNHSQEMYRSRDEQAALGHADTLNRRATEATIEAAPSPAQSSPSTPRTGWSKHSRGRAGHSHPLGEYIERGDDGASIYEDTAFGGGRVVIYDES